MGNSLIINFICALLTVASNSLLKHALRGRLSWRGSVGALMADMISCAQMPLVWLGVVSFAAANVLWVMILSAQRLSIAYPLQITLVFLFSAITSVLVFSEKITLQGGAGLVLILAGVTLMCRQ